VSKSIPIEPSDASVRRPVVSRQPICDRHQRTFAYGVQFREFDTENCLFGSAAAATSRVVFNSIVEMGLGQLVSPSKAVINFSLDFIASTLRRLACPEKFSPSHMPYEWSASITSEPFPVWWLCPAWTINPASLPVPVSYVRMCQIPGEGPSRQYGSHFTTGLFSTLEAFFGLFYGKSFGTDSLVR
jgi:hypothetical protein